ncbi:MAG: hypothetical protein MUP70_00085 [Candidatus Aminicenantes bacterium]|nr:hypothetical protein [Candidatus Aminicenantes bacterium]
MTSIKNMTLGELAAYICTHLKSKDIPCVLSGGACVSIYTKNRYLSYDLDFIENVTTPRKKLREAMAELDFYEKHRYFKHDDTDFFVEFPTGPLSVGSEPVKHTNELEFKTGILTLLSPTDCVKDRLAAYYYWNDRQSLEQAKWVLKHHPVDFKDIRRWSKVEGQLDKYEEIKEELGAPSV